MATLPCRNVPWKKHGNRVRAIAARHRFSCHSPARNDNVVILPCCPAAHRQPGASRRHSKGDPRMKKVIAALLFGFAAAAASAQSWPAAKPVTLLVPFPPGG